MESTYARNSKVTTIAMLFRRVYSTLLSPSKNWYAVTNEICGGPTRYFVNSTLAKRFPEEIVKVPLNYLYFKNGAKCGPKHFDAGRIKDEVHVATTFGIAFGILNQKNSPVTKTNEFQGMIEFINSYSFNGEDDMITNEGSMKQMNEKLKSTIIDLESQINDQRKDILNFQKELADCKKAREAKIKTNHVKPQVSKPNSSFPPSPPPTNTLDTKISPNLKDIQNNDSLRPIHKRKNVEKRTSSIFTEIDNICCSHRESLGTVLGNRIMADDESVQNTMDEVVDLLIERKGTRKGFESVFTEGKWLEYFKDLRQPDWVLLYFKLQARITDDAWQTLLNITNLGRGGVSLLSTTL